jgi:hypothetical protein
MTANNFRPRWYVWLVGGEHRADELPHFLPSLIVCCAVLVPLAALVYLTR